MGKYLEIAQKALKQQPQEYAQHCCTNEDQQLRDKYPTKLSAAHCELSEISEISPVSDNELKTALEDDWDEVSNDPAQLEVARQWVAEAKQVANGVIPERYTCTSNCKYCGPVLVVEGYPKNANNCPWCFNRIKGLPIPRTPHCEEKDDE